MVRLRLRSQRLHKAAEIEYLVRKYNVYVLELRNVSERLELPVQACARGKSFLEKF